MSGDRRPETIASVGEFGLIERIREQLALRSVSPAGSPGDDAGLLIGIGDDAALFRPEPGWDLAITCDTQVCGRHFDPRWTPPRAIGRRAMVVNLSDLAAMGAEPRYALVSLGLPGTMEVEAVAELYRGFLDALSGSPAQIIGGNLTGSGPDWFVDITLIGRVEPERALTRAGARPGDRILVTGSPGRSAAGLAVLQEISELDSQVSSQGGESRDLRPQIEAFLSAHSWARSIVRSYLKPEARLAAGRWLALAAERPATALVDLSDGLIGDLGHLCQRSGVRARVEVARLPDDPDLEKASEHFGRDRAGWTLSPGDDYELLMTVRGDLATRVATELQVICGVPVTDIGAILVPGSDAPGPSHAGGLVEIAGCPPGLASGAGWDHFV